MISTGLPGWTTAESGSLRRSGSSLAIAVSSDGVKVEGVKSPPLISFAATE